MGSKRKKWNESSSRQRQKEKKLECGGKTEKSKCKRHKKCEVVSSSGFGTNRSWGVLTRHRRRLIDSGGDNININININSAIIVASLPEDIISLILTFLLAHLLHNVMIYVCWSWYRLIKNPTFIRKHLLQSQSQSQSTSSPLDFYAHHYYNVAHSELHLEVEINNNQQSHGTKFRVKRSPLPLPSMVVATCNGLILVRVDDGDKVRPSFSLYLANPVTREKVCLPLLPTKYYQSQLITKPAAGIAYIPSLDTYKILLRPNCVKQPLFVLTLGTDTAWRLVDTTIDPSRLHCILGYYPSFAISIDGYLYLFSHLRPCVVLVFEAQSEKLSEIPTPLDEFSEHRAGSFLLSHNNYSCLGLADFKDPLNVQIWALTSLERKEWKKMFNIPIPMDTFFPNHGEAVPRCVPHRRAQVVHCSASGKIVLSYYQKTCNMLWHDVKTGHFEAFVSDKYEGYFFYYARINSLVSPKNLVITRH